MPITQVNERMGNLDTDILVIFLIILRQPLQIKLTNDLGLHNA